MRDPLSCFCRARRQPAGTHSQISDSESTWQPYFWFLALVHFKQNAYSMAGPEPVGNASNLSLSGLIHSQKWSSNIESFLLAGAQGREGAQTIPEVSGKTHSFPPPCLSTKSCWGLKNQKQILHVHGCQAWVPQLPPRPTEDHARKCGPLRQARKNPIISDKIPAAPEGFKRSLIFETSGH